MDTYAFQASTPELAERGWPASPGGSLQYGKGPIEPRAPKLECTRKRLCSGPSAGILKVLTRLSSRQTPGQKNGPGTAAAGSASGLIE